MTKQTLYLGIDPTHFAKTHQGRVTHYPIIRIEPFPLSEPAIHHALIQFEHYTHLIITSKNTVTILHEYLTLLGSDIRKSNAKVVLAVGQVTANQLETFGIKGAIVPLNETAEGVVDVLKGLCMHNAFVFWPHSAQARPVIREYFLENNIKHIACDLYAPVTNLSHPRPSLNDFDEIIFTSPSTVDAFLEIFGCFPSHAKLKAIGPITEECLNYRRGT